MTDLDKAIAYFQKDLDVLISKKIMFPNTKVESVWFESKDLVYYARIVHGGDSAYWRVDKCDIND